jgi:hypothetical protein
MRDAPRRRAATLTTSSIKALYGTTVVPTG